MFKKLGMFILGLFLTFPAIAADNAITVTVGSGPTLRSIDIGGGVQSMGQTIVNSTGTSIVGSGTTMPVSGTITAVTTITNPVTVSQATASSLNATVVQATAASLNATVVGTGTFGVQAAQSGTWNITNISGTVSLPTGAATAAKQPALGTAGTASSDVITVQGITSMTPLLVTLSGTNNINTVSTVTAVTSITNALPAGTNVIGHVIADSGSTTAVTQATSSNLKAQVDPLTIATWGLMVGTTPATAPTNTMVVGAIYNSSAPGPTTGQTLPLQVDSAGNLKVNVTVGASGGTAIADGATFSEGSTSFTPIGGEYVSGGGTNCTSGRGCTAQTTIDRMLYVNIGKVGGAVTGTAGSAGTGVLTVQGIASMTPVLTNPSTAANWALGATGAAVPANALYVGVNNGGNLTGWTGAVSNTGTFAVQATLQASATTAIGKVDPNTIASWGLMSGTVPGTAPTNTMIVGAIYNSSAPTATTGQTLPLQTDVNGNLKVNIIAGAGSGGTAIADKAAWTVSSTQFTLTGGEFTTGGATACSTGQACTVGMTVSRGFFTDLSTVNAVTVLTGSGAVGTGAQRIAVGTDTATIAGSAPGTAGTASSNVVTVQGIASMTKLLVTPDSVALPANQSVNVSQINGVTPLMGNGVTGTGSQRVTIASDNTAFSVNATLSAETTKVIGTVRNVGNAGAITDFAGQNAASPANAWLTGCQFNTSPTTITSTNSSPMQCDNAGNHLVNLKTAIPAGSNLIGKVGIDQTTPGTTNAVTIVPATSGGLTNYFVQPAASDNHVVIKAGAGQVYGVSATNNSATVNYVRLYNATTGFNGCNSATNLVAQWAIPGSTSGAGIVIPLPPQGIAFATGISICVTSGYATTDTTNATASAMSINVQYN